MPSLIEIAQNLIPPEFLWERSFECPDGTQRRFSIGIAKSHKNSAQFGDFNGVIVFDQNAKELVFDGHLSTAKGFAVNEQLAFAVKLLRMDWTQFASACKACHEFNCTAPDFNEPLPSTRSLNAADHASLLEQRILSSDDTFIDGNITQHFTRGEIQEYLSFHRVSPSLDRDGRFVFSWNINSSQLDLSNHPLAGAHYADYIKEVSDTFGLEAFEDELHLVEPTFTSRKDVQEWILKSKRQDVRDLYLLCQNIDRSLAPYAIYPEINKRCEKKNKSELTPPSL